MKPRLKQECEKWKPFTFLHSLDLLDCLTVLERGDNIGTCLKGSKACNGAAFEHQSVREYAECGVLRHLQLGPTSHAVPQSVTLRRIKGCVACR